MFRHCNHFAWIAAVTVGLLSAAAFAQLPDHPIITEVYTDPPGLSDGPVGRDVGNVHQEYIEIYLPTAGDLRGDLLARKDALRLAFYEVEGDQSSSGYTWVNYRIDLPTFDLDPSNAPTAGSIPRPPSGVVVLGWVDFTGDPPTGLLGTPSTRTALINGGITSATDFTFIAINGSVFPGITTTNFPVPVAISRIDLPNEASGGVIQNGSGVYLLVDRDDLGYVELYDDKDPAHQPPVPNADPALMLGTVLGTSALLDGFAPNDDSKFEIGVQPPRFDRGVDLDVVLAELGAFSLLIPELPEVTEFGPDAGLANGYLRVFPDVPKTTENASALDDSPVVDAINAYRSVRNGGPFFATPGRIVLTTSPPELSVASDAAQFVDVLAGTVHGAIMRAANIGGNFPIDVTASPGANSPGSPVTFATGNIAAAVPGRTFALPTVTVVTPIDAVHGASGGTDVGISAQNTIPTDPPMLGDPVVTTLTATVLNPTEGQDVAGLPFQATVFVAIQAIADDPAVANEFLGTSLGSFLNAQPNITRFESLGNGPTLLNPLTNLRSGTVTLQTKGLPKIGEECTNWKNAPGPIGGLDLAATVTGSAEVLSGALTYFESIGTCLTTGETVLNAIRVNIPDTFVAGGTFSPTEQVHFVDQVGAIGRDSPGLSNVTTSRTFEVALIDVDVRSNGTVETGATDDFGIIVQVLTTTGIGAAVVPGEFVFLGFTGGRQGTDIDTLDVPPQGSIVNIIYLDLDNLNTVLGVVSIEAIYIIDGGGTGTVDMLEGFSLNPTAQQTCAVPADCDDGIFCNGAEQCILSVCQPGVPVDCADTISCTIDTCNEGAGMCDHVPNDSACSDGVFCNGAETCAALVGCQVGTPIDCNDFVACTIDSCNEVTHCVNGPDPLFCEDGDVCTVDVCTPTGCDSTLIPSCGICIVVAPPEPDLIGNALGFQVVSAKNRFLSFQGGDFGRSEAVRVTFVSLPPPFDVWNGVQMFVGAPSIASELPGKGLTDSLSPGEGRFTVAALQCSPFFTDWSQVGVVHVHHEGIVPSRTQTGGGIAVPAMYEVQFIDANCSLAVELNYSDPLPLRSSGWADVADLVTGQFLAPDELVSVFDSLALLQKFSGTVTAPIKARAELLGASNGPSAIVDGKITVSDLLAVLNAFSGGGYPFVPPPGSPCP